MADKNKDVVGAQATRKRTRPITRMPPRRQRTLMSTRPRWTPRDKIADAQYDVDKAKAEAQKEVADARCEAQVGDANKTCKDAAKASYGSAVAAAKAKNDAAHAAHK